MNPQSFPSKVDAWLGAVLGIVAAVQLLALAYLFSIGHPARWVAVPLLLLAPALIVWTLASTRYVVDDTLLTVCCGPLRKRIELSQITSIQRTRSPLSSPALSLDRWLVAYGKGQACMISPQDMAGFREALRGRGVHVA